MTTDEISLEPLELLDLQKRRTVGEIVDGMSKCSFGARMLGEVAATLTELAQAERKPILVYDGKQDTPLGTLLKQLVERDWFQGPFLPEEYASGPKGWTNHRPVVVIGNYSERYGDAIHERPPRAIFINTEGKTRPGQVRDGYFPDAIFADPGYIMPVLAATLEERLDGKRQSMDDLLHTLQPYGGLAHEVVHGAHTFRKMVEDTECTVFLTLSGAMTIAQMSLVICDMIEQKMVNYIASTGALMAHGLVQGVGLKHFKYDPRFDDKYLAAHRLNRVTDTLEPEANLDHVEEVLGHVLAQFDGGRLISPRILNETVGKYLAEHYSEQRAIFKSAHQHGVPIIVPASVDSELGNDIYVDNIRRQREGRSPLVMNHELDSQHLVDTVLKAERTGIFTIGGGVPRNNVQNVAPLIEMANERLGLGWPLRQFMYGTRIAPDEMHYGHLSGCTYNEGGSWRKMDLERGQFAEVHADATQVWPFLVRYVMDRREQPQP